MELGKKIRCHREEKGWNQDDLAEKLFVSRQTISNWENDKTYPDIHSIILMGSLFGVSLDQFVKGDIDKMRSIVNETDVRKMRQYSLVMTVGLLLFILSAVPLFYWIGFWAVIPLLIIYIPTVYCAFRIERIKKANDIHTYAEIIAFQDGKLLDDISKQREIGKRPYQKVLVPIAFTALCTVILLVMTLFFHL